MIGSRFYAESELVPMVEPGKNVVEPGKNAVEYGRTWSNSVEPWSKMPRIDLSGANQAWKSAKKRANLTMADWFEAVYRGTGVSAWRFIALLLSALATAGACASTSMRWPVIEQAQIYAMCVVVYMAVDPLRIIGRLLAPQSRGIVGCFAIALVAGLNNPTVEFGILYFVLASFFGWAIYKLNRIWMAGYLWMMTDRVRTALVLDEGIEGLRAWEHSGKRECRTILSEVGLDFNEYVLEAYSKQAYICGYYSGHSATIAANRKAEAAQQEVERARKAEAAALEREEASRAAVDQANEQIDKLYEALDYETKLNNLEKEIQCDVPEEDITHRVLRLMAEGDSERDIVEKTGLTRYAIRKIKKEYQ